MITRSSHSVSRKQISFKNREQCTDDVYERYDTAFDPIPKANVCKNKGKGKGGPITCKGRHGNGSKFLRPPLFCKQASGGGAYLLSVAATPGRAQRRAAANLSSPEDERVGWEASSPGIEPRLPDCESGVITTRPLI